MGFGEAVEKLAGGLLGTILVSSAACSSGGGPITLSDGPVSGGAADLSIVDSTSNITVGLPVATAVRTLDLGENGGFPHFRFGAYRDIEKFRNTAWELTVVMKGEAVEGSSYSIPQELELEFADFIEDAYWAATSGTVTMSSYAGASLTGVLTGVKIDLSSIVGRANLAEGTFGLVGEFTVDDVLQESPIGSGP